MIKAQVSGGQRLRQVIQLAEIDSQKCDVRIVGDPEDKIVVAFAAWGRATQIPDLEWQYLPLKIGEEEEEAIWSSYEKSTKRPKLERISAIERTWAMRQTQVEQFYSNFSGEYAECWFLYDLFFLPSHEAAAFALINWGKKQAAMDEACLGSFQPRSRSELFHKCGLYELGTFRIACADFLKVPRGEDGEVCEEGYAAGGVHRTIFRTDVFRRDDDGGVGPDVPGNPQPYRPGTPILCLSNSV